MEKIKNYIVNLYDQQKTTNKLWYDFLLIYFGLSVIHVFLELFFG